MQAKPPNDEITKMTPFSIDSNSHTSCVLLLYKVTNKYFVQLNLTYNETPKKIVVTVYVIFSAYWHYMLRTIEHYI